MSGRPPKMLKNNLFFFSVVRRRTDPFARCRPQHVVHQRLLGGRRNTAGVHRRLHPGAVRHRAHGQPPKGQLLVRNQRTDSHTSGKNHRMRSRGLLFRELAFANIIVGRNI
jgi:hypothetical protein